MVEKVEKLKASGTMIDGTEVRIDIDPWRHKFVAWKTSDWLYTVMTWQDYHKNVAKKAGITDENVINGWDAGTMAFDPNKKIIGIWNPWGYNSIYYRDYDRVFSKRREWDRTKLIEALKAICPDFEVVRNMEWRAMNDIGEVFGKSD